MKCGPSLRISNNFDYKFKTRKSFRRHYNGYIADGVIHFGLKITMNLKQNSTKYKYPNRVSFETVQSIYYILLCNGKFFFMTTFLHAIVTQVK